VIIAFRMTIITMNKQ